MSTESQHGTTVTTVRVAETPAATARRVILGINPKAGSRGRRNRVAAIRSAVRAAGFDVYETTDLNQLANLADNCQRNGGLRAVVTLGGDGTASGVRNRVPLEVPLLPVPLGTENLLARYVGQRANGRSVCETLQDGVVIDLDLGRVNGRYFLLMMSAGFDAEVVRRLHENRCGNITHVSYVKPTVQAIRSYRYPELRLYCGQNGDRFNFSLPRQSAETVDDQRGSVPYLACRHVFGFNLPLYAFGLAAAPRADGTDGLLDVCTFQRGSLTGTLRYLWHVARGKHLGLPDTSLARCGRFRVEAEMDEHVPFQLDGDYGGELPADVEILPAQLRLLVSRGTASRLGFQT